MSGVVFGCIVPHPPLLVPEVGRGQEEAIISTTRAMERLTDALGECHPETLLIISPHGEGHLMAMGVFMGKSSRGSMKSWGARSPEQTFNNDQELAEAISDEALAAAVEVKPIGQRGYELDHGVMVPMYFLIRKTEGASLLPLTFSRLSLSTHITFGEAIGRAAKRLGRRIAVVASGDLSHRLIHSAPAGYDPLGKVFDEKLVDALSHMETETILNMDLELIEHAGECGLRSILILLGSLKGMNARPEILSYEGPFGVGYLVASFTPECHPLVTLARETVESYVREKETPELPQLTPEMMERAGVFVSIKKYGELRGCIGTFEPTKANVVEEIVANAISSAIHDPRFPPVNASELPYLEYSVDVLTKPEPAESTDELDPQKYGIIVESGGRRGLLLPDLEGVNTVEEQIEICRNKAGIMPHEPVKLYRFQVRRYR